jgi:hypothetical protein
VLLSQHPRKAAPLTSPLAQVKPDTPPAHIYGFEILLGVGTGSICQAGYAVIQAVVPPSDMAYGISFAMLGQLGGMGLGLSIAGAVFVNTALNGLTALLPDASRRDLQLAVAGTSGGYFDSLPDALRDQAIGVLVGALSKVFICVYVGAATCLVLSVCFTVRRIACVVVLGRGKPC